MQAAAAANGHLPQCPFNDAFIAKTGLGFGVFQLPAAGSPVPMRANTNWTMPTGTNYKDGTLFRDGQ